MSTDKVKTPVRDPRPIRNGLSLYNSISLKLLPKFEVKIELIEKQKHHYL